MIPVDDPADLPIVVRGVRSARGITRLDLVKEKAKAIGRDPWGMSSQFCAWERGRKSPTLAALRDYLIVHDVGLALLTSDEIPSSASWCPVRANDAIRSRCAMHVGHGGAHRTYQGVGFR